MPRENETPSEGFAGFALVSKSLAWIGASAGALTLCCTIFGFIVKHTVLEQLGVTRTVFEATSTEYVVSGAKFLGSVVPLALYGAFEFFVICWWAALALALFALAVRKWHFSAELRLFGVAAIYAIWLVAMLLRLIERPSPDARGLDVFAFVTLIGLIYCYIETYLAARAPADGAVRRWGARLPLYALVFCSAFALPYFKGLHGTAPTYPLVEFLGKDRETFCALAAEPTVEAHAKADCAVFELIEQGRDRVLLRKPPGSKIYVVPLTAVNTFAVLPREGR
jgi:hypothetical protein